MEDFWIVVASILLYPLICIACICLPFIAMNVIGFFAKIVDFFKDDPTPPKSTNNPTKNQETSKTTSEKKEPPKQYVRTYPPSSPVVPFHAEEPYKLHFDYSPSSIEGEDLSDFDKERIALIMSIIDSGVSKYLGFSDKVLVDYDFLPINESSDPSFAKLYQSRCLSLNKELKKYGLELWMYNNRAVLSIPVDYALSLPQKYGTPVLSYLTAYCGLRIDFA